MLLLLSNCKLVSPYDPMNCSPSGSSVHGIIQARILSWVAISPPEDLSDPGIEPKSPASPALTGGFFTAKTPRKAKLNDYHALKSTWSN